LYHRLSVIIIEVPPLKDRREDIEELIHHFTDEICVDMRISPKVFSPDALQCMQTYDWTGNIRELRNVVERLIILGGSVITKEDVETYK
ncbi:sigma-54-dependent Fis family transcriptional regulator, partial [Odoribacter sp. OttesenSCG-928-G04]|nr:sigma-54-dependent Fis family transcriptional regulator [Odoribacter sp. OttesenSCG-928-G04]